MLNLMFWRNPSTLQGRKAQHVPVMGQPDHLHHTPSGKAVKIAGFGQLTPAQRQHLQAYGLQPGRSVVVLAQKPVTIVLVEQTELAFETEIARQILVE